MLTPLMAQSERLESDFVYIAENLELENGALYNGEAVKEITNTRSFDVGLMLPHGRGEIFYDNGDRYTGQFYKGKPHGLGTKKTRTSYETHTGSFKEGRAEGYGTLYR